MPGIYDMSFCLFTENAVGGDNKHSGGSVLGDLCEDKLLMKD
jgi:hypothetical protein